MLTADLADPRASARIAEQVSGLGLHIDILVNNAGIGSHGRFVEADPQQLADQIQVNCGSLVDLTARWLPGMIRAGHGVVVNVASTSAFQPVATMAVYAAVLTASDRDRPTRVMIYSGPPIGQPVTFGGPFLMTMPAEIDEAFGHGFRFYLGERSGGDGGHR